ncbi:hypothetical protein [Pseudomonas sp. RL_15y_Pfl2_60]|uniref:hypothetical protein n=1 Tax=Pseudomonas sp. RL_15y_Pfl2_60 TaxID=3088709 RepID=UPI0030D72895
MNLTRYSVVSTLLALLVACGPDQEPAKSPASSGAETQPKESAAPEARVGAEVDRVETTAKPKPDSKTEAADTAVKLDLDLDLEPAPKLETDFEPEIETEPEVEKPVKKSPATKPVAKVPEVKLDLSLPKDLVQQLNDADTHEYNAVKPLPPMFGPKDTQPKPFELSGKLLTDDTNGKGSLDSIDGAQLQFKFKQ